MANDRRGFLKGLTATVNPVRDPFGEILETARSDGSDAAFESLISNLKAEKKYPLLFEARLMQKRHQLGLPLILNDPVAGLDPETQGEYEQATIAAAREVGSHFLADGDIIASWPYFRAIGENGSIAKAIDAIPADEGEDAVIEIAFYEGANPSKGFEMVLARYGICRAITSFSQFPSADGQEKSGRLLVRTLHSELLGNLKSSVRRREGTAPSTGSISELIAGRDWLFEGNTYYIDTSHVSSVVQLSPRLEDRASLSLALELTDYGRCLSEMFQYPGEPPFEDLYTDHSHYLKALLGQEVSEGVAHFRKKLGGSDSDPDGTAAAQALVSLLERIERYDEAIEVSVEYLKDFPAHELKCSSVPQLCQISGDYDRLRKVSRDQGDLLSFTASVLYNSES